eukprot:CAMPEP_0170122328 /NCGR_PEP_ID=MMETSP0020_2-20130122/16598_1 /TAXON_ID=98059 /ORGANISM="Dinobryon sp., Strain UTEXLB2267" /LENGTH=56 /DNA_ID=CAMNT_0010353213 /DNA_START=819 /DNA_END=987 /DNA_ORIENTATION=+
MGLAEVGGDDGWQWMVVGMWGLISSEIAEMDEEEGMDDRRVKVKLPPKSMFGSICF